MIFSAWRDVGLMDVSKLAKVLALAASDNDAEAIHALRTARRLLEAEGADFVELARCMGEGEAANDDGEREALEDAVFDLRNEIRHLRSENERLRQGLAPVPATDPATFQDTARAEAAAIRLRVEVAELRDILEVERIETLRLKAQEATLHQSFQEAIAEAGKLGARITDSEARRLRLEADNQRLAHLNNTLAQELEELQAQQVRFAAELVAHEVRQDLAGTKPKAVAGRRQIKGGPGQYALL
jgi:hypothetical protein